MQRIVGTLLLVTGLVVLILGPVGQAAALDEGYPKPLQPGSSFVAPTDSPTPFWILTDREMRESQKLVSENQLLAESQDLLNKKVQIEIDARKAREDQLAVLQGGYDHYRQLYMDSLDQLQQLQTELSREKNVRRTVTAISFGVALLAGGIALGYTIAQ